MTVFTGTLGGAVSVLKSSVNSLIIILMVLPFRNGIRRCGCLIADDISSRAAMIRSSEDIFDMLYLIVRIHV